eukprot:TRINITY_DN6705_c0_g2_i8.p2 TRINITY_DN6705_c0_g2~~TRINITY_DN6705_c0_g2_i8.p2  ORF type:complete len:194 (+),score=-10.31 TRINITY_DN6705_c0_g2_i8:1292-1873(+)
MLSAIQKHYPNTIQIDFYYPNTFLIDQLLATQQLIKNHINSQMKNFQFQWEQILKKFYPTSDQQTNAYSVSLHVFTRIKQIMRNTQIHNSNSTTISENSGDINIFYVLTKFFTPASGPLIMFFHCSLIYNIIYFFFRCFYPLYYFFIIIFFLSSLFNLDKKRILYKMYMYNINMREYSQCKAHVQHVTYISNY